MKKIISIFILCCLIIGLIPANCYANQIVVTPKLININVNGENTSVLSVKIKNEPYIKLRDIAYYANGSDRQFNVREDKNKTSINIYSNTPYKSIGNEASLKNNKSQEALLFKGKYFFDGKNTNINSYYIGNELYVKPEELGKLLNFIVTSSIKTEQYYFNTNHSAMTKKIGVETAMTYGEMKMSEEVGAWIGYDYSGNKVTGWHQISPGDVRLFLDFGTGPVLVCSKVIVSNGRFYFLEDKLVYKKEINGIKIPLEGDGGISARYLEKVLGSYYETFLKESGYLTIYLGMPAKQKTDQNVSYKISSNKSSISLSVLEKAQINPSLTPTPEMTKKFLYSSSDAKVAFADETGMIYGIGPGTCTISIALEGRSDLPVKTIKVVVNGDPAAAKKSTGFICFDYYDNDVANVFQESTIQAMQQDGADWVSYINTLSYTNEYPIHIGGVSNKNTNIMREIRKNEFEAFVKAAKVRGMRVAVQTQIMYDELLKDYLSEQAKTNEALFYKESAKFWEYFGSFLKDKAQKWVADPNDAEVNKFWDGWFAEYEKNILEYAAWCEEYKVDLLMIGEYQSNPFYSIGGGRIEKLIKNIRNVYSGKVGAICTYTTQWNELDKMSFAGQLDYINVVLQEPYSTKENPTIKEYQQEIEPILTEKIEILYKKYQKKIIITSSYKSAQNQGNKAWFEPCAVQPHINQDFLLQARMYEGLFRALQNKTWVESVWANGYNWVENFEHADGRLNAIDKGQSVRNKPAAKIFLKWANK